MRVLSSLRPDLSRADKGTSKCLYHGRHTAKSGRRKLITSNYATNISHPFSCSSQSGTRSVASPRKESAPHSMSAGRSIGTPSEYYFLVLSTLLPMTPPSMAPAAPPMIAPFTLFLLVTAPITAPAPAPIAASRLVCLTTTGAGAGAL